MTEVLERLSEQGLVRDMYAALDAEDLDDEDFEEIGWFGWVATDAGRDRVLAWMEQIARLFGGWPHPPHDPDDADAGAAQAP